MTSTPVPTRGRRATRPVGSSPDTADTFLMRMWFELIKDATTGKTLKVDYKDQGALKYFLTERGKIIPRRISGNCAKHQREIAVAVKRARMLAILPYTSGTA